ncbi:MAG TPA: hypothetical protein VJM31_02260 [Vicinamibacterales bacterium]|nr:hypothetical protein [Vicinamibacterales bacterium]
MTSWAYKRTSDMSQQDMDRLGEDGWELVAVIPAGPGPYRVSLSLLWKRPRPA